MKSVTVVPLLAIFLTFAGCDLSTEEEAPPVRRPASTVVVNEVFTLPATHPSFYSWIEFYNPTGDTVNLVDWTLSFTTYRAVTTITVALDTFGGFTFLGQTILPDSFGVFDVPFGEGLFDIPDVAEDTVRLPPNGLFTIVNNENRLLDHTLYGPGDQRFIWERPFFQGPIFAFDTVAILGDTLTIVAVRSRSYSFFLQTTEQLVLKNPAGQVVDVVRYGNYVYQGADPYPGNQSLGAIPNFESLARFAGGYFTGNTANDFFVTLPNVRPIPHWYTQVFKE